MTTHKEVMSSTDKKWLKELLKTEPPAGIRLVARRLYQLGEQDFALKLILDQMNRYKDPATHKNIKMETCPAAAIELGHLGDKRAIPDLIEAMNIYTFDAAFALSLLDGKELKKSLRVLSKTEGLKGIGAIFALGLMGDTSVLPNIVDLIKNEQIYIDRYFLDKPKWPWITYQILYILGNYDKRDAEKFFLKTVTRHNILWFLMNYAFEEDTQAYKLRTDFWTLGWRIVKKFGWDRYLKSSRTISMLRDGDRVRWADQENMLVDLIWTDIQESLKKN